MCVAIPLMSSLLCVAIPLMSSLPCVALDGQSDEDGDGGGIGKCPSAEDEKSVGADGVSRYKIDGGTEALLKQFFAPYNARLFALLGRTLPWAA